MFKELIRKLFGKKITVYYKRLNENAKAPYKKHDDDSCWDLYAASYEHVLSKKDEQGNVIPDYHEYGTGLAFAVPKGYEMECRPRSSFPRLVADDSARRGEGHGAGRAARKVPNRQAGHDTRRQAGVFRHAGGLNMCWFIIRINGKDDKYKHNEAKVLKEAE